MTFRTVPAQSRRRGCASRLAPADGRRIRGEVSGNPIWPALHDTCGAFDSAGVLHCIVDGTEMDLAQSLQDIRRTLPVLLRVASAVGLVCLHIYGFSDREAEKHAEHCGVALQLTNIIRISAKMRPLAGSTCRWKTWTGSATGPRNCWPRCRRQVSTTHGVRGRARRNLLPEGISTAALVHADSRPPVGILRSTTVSWRGSPGKATKSLTAAPGSRRAEKSASRPGAGDALPALARAVAAVKVTRGSAPPSIAPVRFP